MAGLGIAAAAALGLWLFLCQIGTCPCPTTCDLLAIVWSSFFGGAVVAAYLFGCCPLMGGFLIALGGIGLIAFLAWAQQCFDWCTMIAYLVSAIVSGVGTLIAILAAIPVVQACALGPVGVGAAVLAALVRVAQQRAWAHHRAVRPRRAPPDPGVAPRGPLAGPERTRTYNVLSMIPCADWATSWRV